MSKSTLLKKTCEVGINTFLSRILGLTREILLMRFLGIGILADAFNTAFMLPNSLRKIFAEGALTAAFLPTFVNVFEKEGKDQANKLTTLAFIVFECILLAVCVLVMFNPERTILLFAPGYIGERVTAAAPMLQILMPFIFFISTSALLAGALNSVHHFFVPAFGPVLLNAVFIGAIIISLNYSFGPLFLCWSILFAGALQCLMHLFVYLKLGFGFSFWNKKTFSYFRQVIFKFIPCLFSMSIMEINLMVDTWFASFLLIGTPTLLKYANRFMGIPLGVFAVAFSTILLPYFTRVKIENPEKLPFYLLEATKFVLWVTLPATLMLVFLSDQVFLTLFASMSSKFPADRVHEAGTILIGFMIGLCAFSLNKILFSLFYAVHDTITPTIISIVATACNIVANYYLVNSLGGFGLALATSCSGFIQTTLCFYFLHKKHNFRLEFSAVTSFLAKYSLQLIVITTPIALLYPICYNLATQAPYAYFFTQSFGFWLWVGPLLIATYLLLYKTKNKFSLNLHFLD